MTQALDGEAEQVLADFVRCVGDVLPTAEDVVTAVADGRCYVGVTTEDLAMQAAASGLSVTVIYPREGGGGAAGLRRHHSGLRPRGQRPAPSSTSCSAAKCRSA